MAAEQMESDGVTRRYRQKIHPVVVRDEWGIIWAGSGPAYVVDKFSDKFRECVGNDGYDRAKLELRVEFCLQQIRKLYSRPTDQIDIVLGVFGRQRIRGKWKLAEFHLYKGSSEVACIAEQKDYCCAGMDCTLAVFLL